MFQPVICMVGNLNVTVYAFKLSAIKLTDKEWIFFICMDHCSFREQPVVFNNTAKPSPRNVSRLILGVGINRPVHLVFTARAIDIFVTPNIETVLESPGKN